MADIPDVSHLWPKVPDFIAITPPPLELPVIPENPLVAATRQNYASEFHRRLVDWISKFDASLSQEYEVGVRLISFGQALVFRLEDLGYWNPSLITFRGQTDDGSPVELIQHVSQISVLLMRVPRAAPDQPKRRIGFHSDVSHDST